MELVHGGKKLEFPVVTNLGHFMLSPPFLYMIGLNALHYRAFSPIHYRKVVKARNVLNTLLQEIQVFALWLAMKNVKIILNKTHLAMSSIL